MTKIVPVNVSVSLCFHVKETNTKYVVKGKAMIEEPWKIWSRVKRWCFFLAKVVKSICKSDT